MSAVKNKIVPCLWLTTKGGKLAKVIGYYEKIFAENFKKGNIVPLGKTPSGNAEMCEVAFFGQKYCFMSTSEQHHPLNDAVSLMINCNDQKEIDTFWNYFTKQGKASQCGWCSDKFGLRWQIIPKNMSNLMSKPGAGKVMMKQTKIIIADYLK